MAVVLDKKTLPFVTNQLRQNGEKIVFCHGSFDLFHVGHEELIKKSRSKGDFLVVALESDARVAMYKGKTRPVIPLEQRIKILQGNKNIDFITTLDEEYGMEEKYYISLYNSFYPNIVSFGKQYDYQKQFRKFKSELLGIKPEKVSHKYEDVQSTTRIIKRINQLN